MKILSIDEYYSLKKENREEWLKYCFNLCEETQWHKSSLKKYSTMYEYANTDRLFENAKKYSKEYLHMSSEELDDLRKKYHSNSLNTKYNSLLDKIINTNNEQELEELFMQDNYKMDELINKINQFIRVNKKDLPKEEQNKLEKDILIKLKPIIEKSKEIQLIKRNNSLKDKQRERDIKTLELFKEVINGNLKENDLFKKIEKPRFNRCLELLKEIDIDLYNKYEEKVALDIKQQQNENTKIEKMIYEIINYLQNGIEDENGIREFDIVDYCLLYSDYIKEIPKQIKECNLSVTEITSIRSFLRQDMLEKNRIIEDNRKRLIEGTDRINCERDKRGYPIPNTGIVIPKEEKISWFEYLENNNLPVTIKTYNAMRKRYLNKIENKKNVKKLTK